ncbi:MAG: aryl-sulfate sulfotransferase [Alphaproteobacteria bacterium]|nr:aryl-sulfate sulfotransferase [Alphaproteobacteria bacterium]
MKPAGKLRKRSVTIQGHRTSVSLEPDFWEALAEVAGAQNRSVAALIAEIDRRSGRETSLSSAIRSFLLAHFRQKSRR